MVNKCCILACVTSQTAAVGRLANKKRAPDGLAGAKTHQTGAIAPFPAQGFAQRPCLRFRARQANPNSNLGTQTPKKRECPMIHARPAKLDSNLGAQRAQGRQIVLTRKCITFCAGLANPQRNAGAPNPRKVRQQRCNAGARRKQHYVATRLAYENTLQFSQKQVLLDCFLKRFQVFLGANVET